MIRHAAVWIFLEAHSAAVGPVVIILFTPAVCEDAVVADEEWARLGNGRKRWRAT
jgi:hypothetical protein